MLRLLHLFPLILVVMLVGCTTPTTANPPIATPSIQPSAPVITNTNRGQQLPISAVAVIPSGFTIQLEVAKTPQQQAMGLMYRPVLANDRGMLFKFPSPQPVRFWMKNVPVALDIVFLYQGVIQDITAAAPPCAKEPCPTYGPEKLVDQVIELRAGRAAELSLKAGDRIEIKYLTLKPKK
ncbi:hypothetical protein NIES4101_43280 [Calothrix sp. NIES-4101]|nr:hypothetical protein NIES4101_43280 [Calothrix sp. NIES-4101]